MVTGSPRTARQLDEALIARGIDACRYQIRRRPIATLAVKGQVIDPELEARALRKSLSDELDGAEPDGLREAIGLARSAKDSCSETVKALRAHAIRPPELGMLGRPDR